MLAVEEMLKKKIENVRTVRIDTFKIETNDNCEALPPIPVPPKVPEELECISAQYDADLIAKSILQLTHDAPL